MCSANLLLVWKEDLCCFNISGFNCQHQGRKIWAFRVRSGCS
eukprot:XP_001709453.1 Hypothetical protein GL50803_37079 [Giardia lamblia ATCC 50803]